MRIVHTSDWHAGCLWKGLDRLSELASALDGMLDYVERERIDLVLVTGDLFDVKAPPAEAEAVVFRFFRRLREIGAPGVVIAGNHDDPSRVDAWGQLADLVGTTTVGHPRAADAGGVIEIDTASGERAVVAALPFAPLRSLLSAAEMVDLAEGASAGQRYADGTRRLARALAERFRPDAVNLLCAHTHLAGARLSGSERRVHVGDAWTARPEGLPDHAHYVALGHIHRPQEIAAPSQTRYAGSVMQLDFAEAGEAKSFVVIDAAVGRPATVELIPYEGPMPVGIVRAPLKEIKARAEELSRAGWLKVLLPEGGPETARAVRAMLDNVVAVEIEPRSPEPLPPLPPEEPEQPALFPEPNAPEPSAAAPAAVAPPARHEPSRSPTDLYRAYCLQQYGQEPEPGVIEAFESLLHEVVD